MAAGLFGLWVIVTFLVLPLGLTDSLLGLTPPRALARYFISFPGSLLAAYGLREQAMRRIAPLNVPHIVNTLRVSRHGTGVICLCRRAGAAACPLLSSKRDQHLNFFATFGIPALVFRTVIGFVLPFPSSALSKCLK